MVKSIFEIPSQVKNNPSNYRNWSASSLNEIEECPKKYFLKNGDYPTIWARKGFPNRISVPQIKGLVIHSVVSRFVKYIRDCELDLETCVVNYLKSNGGYMQILKDAIEEELSRCDENPRAEAQIPSIRDALWSDLSEIRSQAQYFVKQSIARYGEFGSLRSKPRTSSQNNCGAEINSINSEFKIVDVEHKVEGYLDLLITNEDNHHILDYKSSKTISDQYWSQLSLYAWLWNRDSRNKSKGSCTIEIVSGSGISESRIIRELEFDEISKNVLSRIERANLARESGLAEARPSDTNCRFCPVKMLCEPYWKNNEEILVEDTWLDLRIKTIGNVGGNSWKVQLLADGSNAILVFGDRDDGSIKKDQEFRILSAYMKNDEESGKIIRLTQNSEIFRVAVN